MGSTRSYQQNHRCFLFACRLVPFPPHRKYSMHTIPREWLPIIRKALGMDSSWNPPNRIQICCLHFDENDIYFDFEGKKAYLKKGHLPKHFLQTYNPRKNLLDTSQIPMSRGAENTFASTSTTTSENLSSEPVTFEEIATTTTISPAVAAASIESVFTPATMEPDTSLATIEHDASSTTVPYFDVSPTKMTHEFSSIEPMSKISICSEIAAERSLTTTSTSSVEIDKFISKNVAPEIVNSDECSTIMSPEILQPSLKRKNVDYKSENENQPPEIIDVGENWAVKKPKISNSVPENIPVETITLDKDLGAIIMTEIAKCSPGKIPPGSINPDEDSTIIGPNIFKTTTTEKSTSKITSEMLSEMANDMSKQPGNLSKNSVKNSSPTGILAPERNPISTITSSKKRPCNKTVEREKLEKVNENVQKSQPKGSNGKKKYVTKADLEKELENYKQLLALTSVRLKRQKRRIECLQSINRKLVLKTKSSCLRDAKFKKTKKRSHKKKKKTATFDSI